ncbi:hypothetical protein Q7P37_000133 [Cladosporium fusiforme]
MSIKNVCLLGANGNVGPAVLDALVNDNFTVTVLKRSSSKSPENYPSGVKVEQVDDAFAVDDLVPIFKNQDAVVVTIKGTQVDIQKRLADAALKAGVKRFIPADFGSVDSASAHAQECVPLFKNKTTVIEYLTQLAKDNESFSWSSLVCGHFFDWDPAFLHVYPKEKRADIVKNLKASYSTLAQVGKATSRILQRPEVSENRVLFIQSFCVTQMDIVQAFERASDSKYEIEWLDDEAYERQQMTKRDEGDKEALENLVWMLGAQEGNWEIREEFAMARLGLEDESLDEAVKNVVKQHT